jgi:glycosyltransferase involved in cell wall biosynthesis
MLTIIIPYYNQPLMYQKQLEELNKLSDVKVIFIDDCSPTPITPDPKYTYYRITDDMGINWQGARNLGVMEADTDWVLLTDLDHTIPQETIDLIYKTKLDPSKAYKFMRKIKDEWKEPHSNSFLITRYNYMSKGGYDLRWQGTKGGEYLFTNQLDFITLPAYLQTYGSDEIKDAMTHEDTDEARAKRLAEFEKMPKQPFINFNFEKYGNI